MMARAVLMACRRCWRMSYSSNAPISISASASDFTIVVRLFTCGLAMAIDVTIWIDLQACVHSRLSGQPNCPGAAY
jgi:hypothetical protein